MLYLKLNYRGDIEKEIEDAVWAIGKIHSMTHLYHSIPLRDAEQFNIKKKMRQDKESLDMLNRIEPLAKPENFPIYLVEVKHTPLATELQKRGFVSLEQAISLE